MSGLLMTDIAYCLGALNTRSARAVRFEPLSVMRDRWPGWTAAVRTSTDNDISVYKMEVDETRVHREV